MEGAHNIVYIILHNQTKQITKFVLLATLVAVQRTTYNSIALSPQVCTMLNLNNVLLAIVVVIRNIIFDASGLPIIIKHYYHHHHSTAVVTATATTSLPLLIFAVDIYIHQLLSLLSSNITVLSALFLLPCMVWQHPLFCGTILLCLWGENVN